MASAYNSYSVFDGFSVNGQLTLGENIADLGGMPIAYQALAGALKNDDDVDGLTPIQRFLLSWATIWRQNSTDESLRLQVNADPHSPGVFRCNGPLSNFGPFAAAFGLVDASASMRPMEDRVEIW